MTNYEQFTTKYPITSLKNISTSEELLSAMQCSNNKHIIQFVIINVE